VFTIKNILPNGNIVLISQAKSIEVSYDQISLEDLYLT